MLKPGSPEEQAALDRLAELAERCERRPVDLSDPVEHARYVQACRARSARAARKLKRRLGK